MEACFKILQDQIQEEVKYRLDYFDEFDSMFIFQNSDIYTEIYIYAEYDGYEYKIVDLTFGYFESEVYPYDILIDNLYIIRENIINNLK